MNIVRLSGRVQGKDDPSRIKRAELLYNLFASGWDIYNGNGDQSVTLGNIQEKIIESNAFVFMPGANLEDFFHAASIFVGIQTQDRDLLGKSVVILNSDNSWNPLLELVRHLNMMGTISQEYSSIFSMAEDADEVLKILEDSSLTTTNNNEPDILEASEYEKLAEKRERPDFRVCVFCSASIKKQDYLDEGYKLGATLAKNGWGCVSGAGSTGIMGQVTTAATENGGWTGGSNVPHIIELEGLPDGLDEFWPRGDIYTRMEVMIAESHAFIIMPGGMGTMQELFAILLLKQQDNDLMAGKEVFVVNKFDVENGNRFWQPLLAILDSAGMAGLFRIVDSVEEAIDSLKEGESR